LGTFLFIKANRLSFLQKKFTLTPPEKAVRHGYSWAGLASVAALCRRAPYIRAPRVYLKLMMYLYMVRNG
jgi:hypothetical protein